MAPPTAPSLTISNRLMGSLDSGESQTMMPTCGCAYSILMWEMLRGILFSKPKAAWRPKMRRSLAANGPAVQMGIAETTEKSNRTGRGAYIVVCGIIFDVARLTAPECWRRWWKCEIIGQVRHIKRRTELLQR